MAERTGRRAPRPNYGQGRRRRKDGYIDLWRPGHPIARSDGYVFEHRAMAWDAGLLTDPADQVHHVNEVRDDNRLENFRVLSAEDHQAEHHPVGAVMRNQHGSCVVKPPEMRPTAPKPDRACEGCGEPVPPTLKRTARFCSPRCQVAAWKRRNRAA